jgi:hypothetical protein
MRRAHASALVVAALLVGGCYEYLPVTNAAALSGRRFQLVLTEAGAVALASRVGPSVEALEGTFLGDSAGSYQIAMTTSRTRNGVETDWRGERVSVPRELVASVLERKFSPSRTAFATGLTTVGVGAITAALRGKGEGGGGGPTVGTPVIK